MPRHREEGPGVVHHVYARGVRRQPLFLGDEDYEQYIRLLVRTIESYRWRALGFCLMPNHLHLLIETPEPNLGAGMQWLQSRYAITFNERHGRTGEGHVFQGPYGSKPVLDERYLLTVAAYIIGNPVTAGLCEAPEDWPWSSFGLVSQHGPRPWLAHEELWERVQVLAGGVNFVDTLVM